MNRSRPNLSRSGGTARWTVERTDPELAMNFFGQPNSTMRAPDESSIVTSMSFASLQIGECKPSEGQDEVDKRTFEQWRDILEAAMTFAGITDEAAKASIFKMKAGVKLIDVLENTPNVDTPDKTIAPYSNIMRRLRDYYGSRDYTLLQRQKLRAMVQESNESDLKYVKRLAAVAKLCAYSNEQLIETVTDVIQAHALNQKVREAGRKVARKGGSIQELLDKVRVAEIEKQAEDIFSKNHPSNASVEVNAVSAMSTRPRFGRGNGNARGRFPRTRGGGRSSDRPICWRCTSKFHRHYECYAIDKICRACQVKGHIERACTKQNIPAKRRADDDVGTNATPPKTRKIAAITAAGESELEDPDDKKVSVTMRND